LGKTTFLRSLFHNDVNPPLEKLVDGTIELPSRTSEIIPYLFELEADDGVRLAVEAIDTPGYDDDITSIERSQQLLKFVEKTFDDVFEEERRIHRNPKFEEHRIHALLYFIEPTGLGYPFILITWSIFLD
jgi:cell division control protein 11